MVNKVVCYTLTILQCTHVYGERREMDGIKQVQTESEGQTDSETGKRCRIINRAMSLATSATAAAATEWK